MKSILFVVSLFFVSIPSFAQEAAAKRVQPLLEITVAPLTLGLSDIHIQTPRLSGMVGYRFRSAISVMMTTEEMLLIDTRTSAYNFLQPIDLGVGYSFIDRPEANCSGLSRLETVLRGGYTFPNNNTRNDYYESLYYDLGAKFYYNKLILIAGIRHFIYEEKSNDFTIYVGFGFAIL